MPGGKRKKILISANGTVGMRHNNVWQCNSIAYNVLKLSK